MDGQRGMIIQSGNDAAIGMAEHVAGSEEAFVSLMNAYATRIGMTGSHFVNPHGLSAEGHYSTAHDLALLGRALIHDFPVAYSYNKIKEVTGGPDPTPNRNLPAGRAAPPRGHTARCTSAWPSPALCQAV